MISVASDGFTEVGINDTVFCRTVPEEITGVIRLEKHSRGVGERLLESSIEDSLCGLVWLRFSNQLLFAVLIPEEALLASCSLQTRQDFRITQKPVR